MVIPDNKRKASDGDGGSAAPNDDGQQAKRARGADGAPKPKPALDLSVLAKAKKALEKQKELKEKLERMKQASSKAAAQAAAPSAMLPPGGVPGKPTTRLPPPLVVDDHGRQLGAASAVAPAPEKPPVNPLLAPVEESLEDQDPSHYDPFLGTKGARSLQRRPRSTLQFVEEGRFQKQADEVRLRAQFGDTYVRHLEERRQREQEEAAAAGGMDPNLIPLGVRAPPPGAAVEDAVPAVEWWDARILANKTSYGAAADGEDASLRVDRITHYIEHPVLLDPPAEAPPPPPQPLKLTKQEMKKLRTQRRLAREQEKQELIRQGLLEPPKPKVKISNLMRVLGAEAAADPTTIEAEVRKQMAERAAAHEDRNLARMLTPAERRQKKLNKLLDKREEDGGEPVVQVAVYKVGDLSTPQLKFKVEVNAKENHLTGTAVCVPGEFCVVVVEGGPKTLRRYEKLMLRRIDWNAGRGDDADDDGDDEMDRDGVGKEESKLPNYCHLVWTGVVKDRAFRGRFRTEEVRNVAAGRLILEDKGVGHYWDLAAAFVTE